MTWELTKYMIIIDRYSLFYLIFDYVILATEINKYQPEF